mmetsp:Transcript_21380/g.23728  ORF Transcript_21380/g.23728 Transcript_21380/m.23728 type:complete len:89 (-) Transcript_21380:718-984(-)
MCCSSKSIPWSIFQERRGEQISLIRSTGVDSQDQHNISNLKHEQFNPDAPFTNACNFFDVIRFFGTFFCHVGPIVRKTKVQNDENDRK